jgi:hypothetical protein
MQATGSHPRRQVYVNRTIQGRMLRRFALMWFIYHVVLWNAMFLYRYLQYRGELLAGAAPLPFADLYSDFCLQHYSVLVCALAVLPVLLWDMVRMSHRVAGPLVRFQRALSEIAEGRPVDRVQIRDGDLLIEFQDEFNAFLEKVGMMKRGEPKSSAGRDDEPAAPTGGETTVVRDLHDLQETVTRGMDPSRAASGTL